MSTFPGAIDSFPTWQDGVDTVTAAMPNNIQSSVLAVENCLGVNPQGAFASVGAAVAAKVNKAGDTLSGDLDMAGNAIKNLAGPEEDLDAANKQYVRSEVNPAGIRWRDDFLADKSPLWTLSGGGGSYTQNAELGGTGTLSTGATSGNQAILSYGGKGCTDSSKDPHVITRAKIGATTQIKAVLAGLWKDSSNRIELIYELRKEAETAAATLATYLKGWGKWVGKAIFVLAIIGCAIVAGGTSPSAIREAQNEGIIFIGPFGIPTTEPPDT